MLLNSTLAFDCCISLVKLFILAAVSKSLVLTWCLGLPLKDIYFIYIWGNLTRSDEEFLGCYFLIAFFMDFLSDILILYLQA